MGKKIKNIFVSHYHTDADNINKLIGILGKKGVDVHDSSIYEDKEKNNANNKEYIKTLIKPKIEWAGTLITLIGEKTSSSEWVNWEIKKAAEGGKRIVGIFLRGAKDSDIPEALKQHGDALVAWNPEKIRQAVLGKDIWEDPNGLDRKVPFYDIKKYTC